MLLLTLFSPDELDSSRGHALSFSTSERSAKKKIVLGGVDADRSDRMLFGKRLKISTWCTKFKILLMTLH